MGCDGNTPGAIRLRLLVFGGGGGSIPGPWSMGPRPLGPGGPPFCRNEFCPLTMNSLEFPEIFIFMLRLPPTPIPP